MTDITFLDAPEVRFVDGMGHDYRICEAARVSTGPVVEPVIGDFGAPDLLAYFQEVENRNRGLINYLMRNRHGSPFEHGSMTFYVKAPIFVAREFMRHRIGWSYNEMSGRYTELLPEFYVPAPDRPLVNVGTSARPEMTPGDRDLVEGVECELKELYAEAWSRYQVMLSGGVANEVARMVLPVGIMTQFYATCNPRSMMAFLSLRVDSEDSTYRSRPQYEIQQVAERMEEEFSRLFPFTHEAFVNNGRVGP